jgi:hypothetical protein
MREKFKIILSRNYNDISLIEKMLDDYYKLITIVMPNNYPYAFTVGYIYLFEDIYKDTTDIGDTYMRSIKIKS